MNNLIRWFKNLFSTQVQISIEIPREDVRKNSYRPWTREEIDLVKNSKKTNEELALQLCRSAGAIASKKRHIKGII